MDSGTLHLGQSRLLPRLVSEDDGKTWRIAELDDEARDDLTWDALFAPPGPAQNARVEGLR